MGRRIAAGLAALLVLVSAAGCTYTVAGDTPAAIEPPRPSVQPSIEYTVADFSFALGGGDPETSLFDGEMLSTEVMQAWQERGYVRTQELVDQGAFSGAADYQLTACGPAVSRPDPSLGRARASHHHAAGRRLPRRRARAPGRLQRRRSGHGLRHEEPDVGVGLHVDRHVRGPDAARRGASTK